MPDGIDNPVQGCSTKKTQDQPKPTPHWIKFKMQDDKGKPLPGVTLSITLPDGKISENTSGDDGVIHIANIPSGNCKIESDWTEYTVHETVFIQS